MVSPLFFNVQKRIFAQARRFGFAGKSFNVVEIASETYPHNLKGI
tara:strand:- start:365 stop:499 length:135 start_codon:yes stop_codon:yes gene_type:complete